MSVFKLIKSESIQAALKKSGQYLTIPPEILNAVQSDNYLPDNIRTKISNTFSKSGKLNPEDVKKILNNRNVDVISGLLSRNDLDKDVLHNIVSHEKPLITKRADTRFKNKMKSLYSTAFSKLSDHDNNIAGTITESGSPKTINRLMDHGSNLVSGRHLFDMITKRKDLDTDTLNKIIEHRSFDQSHLDEIYKHSDPEVVINALKKVGRSVNGNYNEDLQRISSHVNFLMQNGSPEIKKALLNSYGVIPKAIRPDHIDEQLKSSDPELVKFAISHISKPEQAKYVINNVIPNIQNPGELIEGLADKHKFLDESDVSAMTNTALQKAPDILNDYAFKQIVDKIPESDIRKILSTKSIEKERYIREGDSEDTHGLAMANANSGYEYKRLFDVLKNPAQIHQLSQQLLAHGNRHADTLSRALENHNTAPETLRNIHQVLTAHGIDDSRRFARHPNTPPEVLDQHQLHENPNIRQNVAYAPNPTNEQILRGIRDKDKNVRSEWINRAGDKFSDEHFKELLKDRSPKNRAEVAKNPRLSPEVLKHILSKDKSEDVRMAAIDNHQITPELLELAANDASPAVKLAAIKHNKAPDSLLERVASGPVNLELAQAIAKKNLSPQAIENVFLQLKTQHSSEPNAMDAYGSRRRRTNSTQEALAYYALKHPENHLLNELGNSSDLNIHSELIGRDNNRLSPEALTNIWRYNSQTPSSADFVSGAIASHKNLPESVLNSMLQHPESYVQQNAISGVRDVNKLNHLAEIAADGRLVDRIIENPNTNADTLKAFLKNTNPQGSDGAFDIIQKNPEWLTSEHVDQVFNHFSDGDAYSKAARLLSHPKISESTIRRAMKHPSERISMAAGDALSHHDPDAYNHALEGHEVHVHPATEKLKHLKGKIDEAGGVVHKNELPNKGAGIDGKLLNGKGELTSESIDKHLESLPKHKFNVSYDTWDGAQMHDDVSGPQKVLQLNMTNDHIKQLKEQGLWDTFKKMHDISKRSGHPIKNHTLGWARIDDSHNGHWHIDEIQSDLGQGTIRQIENAKQSGQMSEEEANKYTDHLKKMIKIFSGPFKNINHAIFGAVHQTARDKDINSTSMDTLKDQAKQSGMSEGRDLPGHMHHTYSQMPEEVGYKEASKKDVMPNTKAPESHLQVRKLVKSMAQLRDLLAKLESK